MGSCAFVQTDTVVIGNGPASLILSYILHGHVPYYSGGHHDVLLHKKLAGEPDLLHPPTEVFEHLQSSLKYTSQALPVNTLLDTLLRPHGDADIGNETCVTWRHEVDRATPHLVLGSAPRTGGQWADNPVVASWDIGSLSYADQLSLPGYTIGDHWKATKKEPIPDLIRPTRRDVASYYAAYPKAVGIADSIRTSATVYGISRTSHGFYIASHNISCRNLVLASGIFSVSIPPPRFLSPLSQLNSPDGPLLVIGSGFTAADIIISTPPERPIVHLFNWDPEQRPSPLRACHSQAYPEYAEVYRQMKIAALKFEKFGASVSGNRSRPARINHSHHNNSSTSSGTLLPFTQRDWSRTYEGFPNARILSTHPTTYLEDNHVQLKHSSSPTAPLEAPQIDTPTPSSPNHHNNENTNPSNTIPPISAATLEIGRSASGLSITRTITSFHYATGRRGSLAYLSPSLLREVLAHDNQDPFVPLSTTPSLETDIYSLASSPSLTHDFAFGHPRTLETAKSTISGSTLRDKLEEDDRMEVAPRVFVVGSLTGDSLVRFAFGGCAVVAGRIGDDYRNGIEEDDGDGDIDGDVNVNGDIDVEVQVAINGNTNPDKANNNSIHDKTMPNGRGNHASADKTSHSI